MSAYEIIEHKGRPALHLRTATRAGLVSGAIEGMFALSSPTMKDEDAPATERAIAIKGKDFSELFHRLLNEAIILAQANGEAYEGIKLSLITETDMQGSLLTKGVSRRGKELTGAGLVGGAVAKNEAGQWDVTVEFAERQSGKA